MSSIGTKIRLARQHAGLSVAELAAACGVSAKAVYHWESDLRSPLFTSVEAVARATSTPLEFFTKEETGETAADTAVHR